jgi:hypothetical protein
MKLSKKNIPTSFKSICTICLLCLIFTTSCKKYLDIPPTPYRVSGDAIWSTDNQAVTVVNEVFLTLASTSLFMGKGVGYSTGLYTDDLQSLSTANASEQSFYTDAAKSTYSTEAWTTLYAQLYQINLAIEGIRASKANLTMRNQLIGESLFLRAFMHFHLSNLYGDIVLVTSTNYLATSKLPRSPRAEVFRQIIADLQEAEGLLSPDYMNTNGIKITNGLSKPRPNKYSASALLARVYLYNNDWANAEAKASLVIDNPLYALQPRTSAFLSFMFSFPLNVDSRMETIMTLQPIWYGQTNSSSTAPVVLDNIAYRNSMPATLPAGKNFTDYVNVAFSASFMAAFEPGDVRKTNWIRSSTKPAAAGNPAQTLFFPNKYTDQLRTSEAIVLLRIGEQYLIRAEARAQLNNLAGAKEDLNKIRNRAGLGVTAAVTRDEILAAVLKERRVELFTEGGHRFFDLRRMGKLDEVMNVAAPLKGGVWNPLKQYWPIPERDITYSPQLTQTPGY